MKKTIAITLDEDLYHNIRHAIPERQLSSTINELLISFLRFKGIEDTDLNLIEDQIEEKTRKLEEISGEVTSLKVRRTQLLKERLAKEKEETIQSKAFHDSMINAGFVRDLRG